MFYEEGLKRVTNLSNRKLCYLISLDLFLKYVLKQWILMWVFPCSHLMENQISNIEKGVFDELKELERLWEHITKTFTSINQINFPFKCFLSQEMIAFFPLSFFCPHSRLNKNRLSQLPELLFQKNEALSRLWVQTSELCVFSLHTLHPLFEISGLCSP